MNLYNYFETEEDVVLDWAYRRMQGKKFTIRDFTSDNHSTIPIKLETLLEEMVDKNLLKKVGTVQYQSVKQMTLEEFIISHFTSAFTSITPSQIKNYGTSHRDIQNAIDSLVEQNKLEKNPFNTSEYRLTLE